MGVGINKLSKLFNVDFIRGFQALFVLFSLYIVKNKSDMEHMLPDEVMFDILSRLPIKTIIWCKCLCKKWLNLVSESYFIDLHLSRSPEGLLIHHCTKSDLIMSPNSKPRKGILKWVTFDEDNHYQLLDDTLKTLDLKVAPLFQNIHIEPLGSVNGLIFLHDATDDNTTYICNPITREYIILSKPKVYFTVLSHGFGVSVSGEYKVIRICRREKFPYPIEIEVHTLGCDQWINHGPFPYDSFKVNWDQFGVFLNGYVHWVVDDELYAFDLENFTFQLFPTPPGFKEERDTCFESLDVAGGCLSCLLVSNDEIKVWEMKEHGTKGSWHQKVMIRVPADNCESELGTNWDPFGLLISSFKGKSAIYLHNESTDQVATYYFETGTIETKTMPAVFVKLMNYSPSFLKIKNFGSGRVHVHAF